MWHDKSIEDILKELNTNKESGLKEGDIPDLIEKYGKNMLSKSSKNTLLKLIFDQINNILIYILIIAAIISIFLGESEEALIIFLVIILNTTIGILQESKAEKSLEALKSLSSPSALVKRDGKIKEISSEDLVPGDIISLETGRIIPADIRLFDTSNLKVDESALTGESLPVDKESSFICDKEDIPLGDRKNLGYMSTIVTYGRGYGIVVSTGMNTEIGKIASYLNDSKKEITPLQGKLNILGKNLGIITIVISIVILILGLLQGKKLFDIFFTSISLAVAAIPEGLPTVVAIVLALGVQRMIKKNAIVRKLSSVETLGSVNIICSDKTGTLTLNKMTVMECFINNKEIPVSDFRDENDTTKFFLYTMNLCNDAVYTENSKIGDPTEIALLEFCHNMKKTFNFKRIDEIPFDSDRKLMTTINIIDGKSYSFTKGAVDNLLSLSTKISINGEIKDLTSDMKREILKSVESMADNALRTLGFSYKEVSDKKSNYEEDMIFLGMVGMIDPPRNEVKDSIAKAKNSGIKTIMITGDHKNTAFSIGHELGIAKSIDETMLGFEIDQLSDEEFKETIKNISIFARVSPEHKVKIVRALKASGNIVSMTGDGVNDAPSLKMADVGIAMGITGTDVSKSAADIILTDDNFKTIITAVEEGRNIFNNIKKSIMFLLTCNLGEILTIFISILFKFPIPLNPTHLLWINLITDSLPALSLGVDTYDKNIMEEKPKSSDENILSSRDMIKILIEGSLIGIVSIIAFMMGYKKVNIIYGQSMAFIVLSFSQLFLSLSIRSNKEFLIKIGIFSNMKLIYSILIGIVIQIILMVNPFLSKFFSLSNLSMKDWVITILLSILPFILNELLKPYYKKLLKRGD